MRTCALLLLAASPALASSAVQLTPKELVWNEKLPNLPPGAKAVVLEGDPKKADLFTMRIELPPRTRLPPHWHPRDERVVVLSGSINVAFVEPVELPAGRTLPAGSFYVNPAHAVHYVWTDEGATIQLTGVGPWEIRYEDAPPAPEARPVGKPAIIPKPSAPAAPRAESAAPPAASGGVFADIKSGKTAAGVYKIEGVVVETAKDSLTIAEFNAQGERLTISTKNASTFEVGQRYGFSVRLTQRPSAAPGQAFEVELGNTR